MNIPKDFSVTIYSCCIDFNSSQKMHRYLFLFIAFCCFAIPFMNAQKTHWGNPPRKSFDEIDTLFKKNKPKNFLITPYIAPTYTPELKLLISTGGLMTFKVQPDNPIVERSSIPFSIGYSTNGSTAISILPYIYGSNDLYRILTKFYYKNMPDNYWGVGYDAGIRTSSPNETTKFRREWFSIEGSVVRKISKGFFVGLSYDLNRTNASNINNYMSNDNYIIKYGNNITNFGIGLVINLDRRDNVQTPYKGYLASLSVMKYNRILRFSDSNEFAKTTLDLRKYFPIGHKKILALQYKMQVAHGNTPWSDLPQFGTPYDLRGYQWGRFRDNIAIFGLSEYRHMFSGEQIPAFKNIIKHFGFAAWIGFGSVAHSYNYINNFLFNAGTGLRIEIQPRSNIRIDYGFAEDNSSLYISFSEAF